MVFQIPGGWLALKVGGARLFGTAVLVASVFTLLTPLATRWSAVALIILRILEGLVLVSLLQDLTITYNSNNLEKGRSGNVFQPTHLLPHSSPYTRLLHLPTPPSLPKAITVGLNMSYSLVRYA